MTIPDDEKYLITAHSGECTYLLLNAITAMIVNASNKEQAIRKFIMENKTDVVGFMIFNLYHEYDHILFPKELIEIIFNNISSIDIVEDEDMNISNYRKFYEENLEQLVQMLIAYDGSKYFKVQKL